MEIIKKENKTYINVDYILEKAPIYSKGCRSSRELIKKKNIENSKYIYGRKKEKDWIITDGKSIRYDKVFILKDYLKNIAELQENSNEKIIDEKGIEKAPNKIKLEENQKFKDGEGKIIEIETRGERTIEKIYFKVKDVMNGFGMENLQNTIIDKNTRYTEDKHYKFFIIKKSQDMLKKTNNNKIMLKKELYLTYEGILRILFVSENNRTESFIKWATETLFVVQMGTKEQKEELVSNVLGVNAKVIKEVFNIDRNTIPCVYLFTLNTVEKLRESMKIDMKYADDSIVAKYGFTKDLNRRTGEHISKYNKIENVELKLKNYSYVDPQYMSQAETDIRDYMIGFETKLEYDKEDELVIIPKNLMKMVERQYELIGKSYMGHISELITKIKELEDRLEKERLQHEIELQYERHKNEIKNKDIEILEYKIKLLEIQCQKI
jgi:hypothetical protein